MTKLACVFPGQGSQSVGMLNTLAEHAFSVQETFAEASEALNYDLWKLVQEDDGTQLNQTHITQPALLTASVAAWRVLQAEKNLQVDYLAGHSLGEYSALTCAGVLNLSDAVTLVQARGEFMQQAVPAGVGAMYAIIGLDDAKIMQICQEVSEETAQVVSAVNFNSPGQVVIAGHAEAAEKAGLLCKEAGAKRALPLAVSVPSHCALMKPAAEKLATLLEDVSFNTPNISVINNVDVSIETDAGLIKDALLRQLYMPVRWTESVLALSDLGVDKMIEVGPGKVLSGLNKRINKSLSLANFSQPSDFENI
ncbi:MULTISPECIES: ACP S-malonyltransferase [Alteromonadaceae]|uniref:Malonyl CoA-acyl carrier protein transacylase n=1 Tax=Brumicola blandensis TaxID=3075611 RepID=A0AAW8QXW9_9ALTE|nr:MULTISPECIES: ACP S-malonyltransferase [unclassified Alteromonas]MDT0581359.1 ACP S-malonyltransferase [Alteromonas sp. W409]MDT0626987.1 ACP S-malonyltransferase [Alteromonas sp. W364]